MAGSGRNHVLGRVRFKDRVLQIVPGGRLKVEVAISLPRLEGRKIPGIPHDHAGFVRIDDRCRVLDCEHHFAAGDVTNFPVKQGGVATQQADVIAEVSGAELDLKPRWGGPEGKIVGKYLTQFLASAVS